MAAGRCIVFPATRRLVNLLRARIFISGFSRGIPVRPGDTSKFSFS